jgi:predicted RNA-binding Zn-ribbon protein involved in translation (DUF1610 family)
MPVMEQAELPDCPKCGALMMLSGVEPYPIDHPTHERRTFECDQCGHSESIQTGG